MATTRKVHRLNFQPEYDFFIIGIASHVNDYKLTWSLNQQLGFDLMRVDDLEIVVNKGQVTQRFSRYFFEHEESMISYDLVANLSENGHLVKEHQNIDYFLRINGEIGLEDFNKLLNEIKCIDGVISAFRINPATIRHPEVFVF